MAVSTGALLIAGTSAMLSATAAAQQNQAIKKSMAATRQATRIQGRQVDQAAMLERKKATIASEKARGRIRVAAAASGMSVPDSTYESILIQNEVDNAINQNVIEQNRRNQMARVMSSGEANLAQLASQMQSVFMSTFQGGLSGLAAGMAISPAGGSVPGADTPVTNIGGSGGLPSGGLTFA